MAAHWDTRIDGKCYPLTLFIQFSLINTCSSLASCLLGGLIADLRSVQHIYRCPVRDLPRADHMDTPNEASNPFIPYWHP